MQDYGFRFIRTIGQVIQKFTIYIPKNNIDVQFELHAHSLKIRVKPVTWCLTKDS